MYLLLNNNNDFKSKRFFSQKKGSTLKLNELFGFVFFCYIYFFYCCGIIDFRYRYNDVILNMMRFKFNNT